MAIKTQGTNLYFINPQGDTVVAVLCVTSIDGISASRGEIDVTCLEDLAKSYEAGMIEPGTATFTINFDPSASSHIALHDKFVDGTVLQWALGWSDGVAPPTVDSTGEAFDTPTSRSWLMFSGHISEFPFSFPLSAVVTSSIGIRMSGMPVMVPKV